HAPRLFCLLLGPLWSGTNKEMNRSQCGALDPSSPCCVLPVTQYYQIINLFYLNYGCSPSNSTDHKLLFNSFIDVSACHFA
ncbi:hypothetical protein EDB86DRAFT_3004144, partial [Lactarius hatsudake]